jgi:Heparinase II/III-like protein/Heparinase II/III N-terminus
LARIWITVDVEAQPNRAEKDHVERLIWGRFGGAEFGIGRLMDIADANNSSLTMFTDLAETDRYGQEMADVAAQIDRRGHDLQLHVHSEFFSQAVWDTAGATPITDLNHLSAAQASCIADELVRRYKHIAGRQPLAFRGGGYRFNEELLRALRQQGVVLDSSVNRSRQTQPFDVGVKTHFFWPNGMLEVPISVVDGFGNNPRPFDFNFNSAYFPTHSEMIDYVNLFEKQFGSDEIIVLVMHSWSLLDISQGGYFGPPLEKNAIRFEKFIRAARLSHDFVTSSDIVNQMHGESLATDLTVDPRERGGSFWGPRTPFPKVPEDVGSREKSDNSPIVESTDLSARLRRYVSARALVPLEEFGYPWHNSVRFRLAMEAMLAGRWEKSGDFVTDMRPPINFDDQPRPHACDLHSWEPVGYALRAHEVFGDERYLEISVGYVCDWLDRYFKPVSGSRAPSHLDGLIADASNFAWYDMAVGRRIFRLAYVLDLLARRESTDPALLDILWNALQFHHAILGREHFFRAHSNHGIHQAMGQLAAAKRFSQMPESGPQLELARERLTRLLDAHFTSEGVHKEHSPGYHYGLMASLIGAHSSGLLSDSRLIARVRTMEEALSWMIMPNGRIAPFGDTDPMPMDRSVEFVEQFSHEGLRHQMTRGQLGAPLGAGIKVFRDSGYFFARIKALGDEPNSTGFSYFAQNAAFHSTVHKHADHLSFIWYDCGRDILIDPGRYAYNGKTLPRSALFDQGFWYSDPKRIYVESTRAHNCVEIDSRSYPRKDVKPFGSALIFAGEQNGLAVTVCEVRHPGGIRHRRVLVMAPGRFLLTLDFLHDRLHHHDYRQWFQFAPEWQAEGGPDGVSAQAPASDDRPAAALRVFNLLDENNMGQLVCGQEAPHLQGWHSDAANSLKPSASLAVEALDRKMGRFATLLVLDGGAQLDREATRFNATLRHGAVSWTDRHGSHVLILSLDTDGNVQTLLGGPELARSAAVLNVGKQGLRRGFLQRIFNYLRP